MSGLAKFILSRVVEKNGQLWFNMNQGFISSGTKVLLNRVCFELDVMVEE